MNYVFFLKISYHVLRKHIESHLLKIIFGNVLLETGLQSSGCSIFIVRSSIIGRILKGGKVK